MPFALAALLDLVTVLIFAALGRRNHGESSAVLGVFETAWPFLVGALVGWILLVVLRRTERAAAIVSGIIVWVATVAVGMLIRHFTGRGTAFAFICVATIFNGIVMLGWRGIAALVLRRKGTTA